VLEQRLLDDLLDRHPVGTGQAAPAFVRAVTDHSRPPLRRALRSSNGNGVSPLTAVAAAGAVAAAVNEVRRH
jgi:hypothetical protein